MEQSVRDVLENRQMIVDNVDKLVALSRNKNKFRSTGQLSLFGEETIELDKPSLDKRYLSDLELLDIVRMEEDVLGMSVTYDLYGEYVLIEKTLCNITLSELEQVINDKQNAIFIAKLARIRPMQSKTGNKYLKLYFVRNGLELEMYLFGEYYESNLRNLFKDKIYIVRCNYNSSKQNYIVTKVQDVTTIDPSKYIKSINIRLDKLQTLQFVKALLYTIKSDNGVNVTIELNDSKYPYRNKVWLDAHECNRLINKGCKIELNRSL